MPKKNKSEYNSYMREYMYQRYHNRMSAVIDELGGKCAKCGSLDRLEIDHIDPAAKEFTVSRLCSVSEEKLREELVKCQLLCYRCHKDKHSAKNKHGTLSCYRYCKCDLCRKAKSDWQKEYTKRL